MVWDGVVADGDPRVGPPGFLLRSSIWRSKRHRMYARVLYRPPVSRYRSFSGPENDGPPTGLSLLLSLPHCPDSRVEGVGGRTRIEESR